MSLVIRTLVVEALFSGNEQQREVSAQVQNPPGDGTINEELKVRIIDEAVQQVMEILERQKDR